MRRCGPGGPAAVPEPGLGFGRKPCGASPPHRGAGGHRLPHQAAAGPGMLAGLVAEGTLPVRWVTCDEGFGGSHDFLDGVADLGLGYLAEVPRNTHVWTTRPQRSGAPSCPVFPAPPQEGAKVDRYMCGSGYGGQTAAKDVRTAGVQQCRGDAAGSQSARTAVCPFGLCRRHAGLCVRVPGPGRGRPVARRGRAGGAARAASTSAPGPAGLPGRPCPGAGG